ncbi:MAG: helicase [Bacteroidetes bacterium]|nr:MAG: helicase [Bacteroidota bacterium]
MRVDPQNKAFQAAFYLVEETNHNVFLTGKAGTGKTTFLRYFKQYGTKKAVIVAPTGVAAVNAGGMTIHSLFTIPPSVYPPNDPRLQVRTSGVGAVRTSLQAHFMISKAKRKIFKEMELLIVDEISMVRCDLLDVMDRILRYYGGRRDLPFGGKQLLFIGDAYQLPPVTTSDAWDILRPHYQTPYFFGAQSWREANPKLIELQKVYRQSDCTFVDILNRIREGEHTQADIDYLNQHYEPLGFDYASQGYIYLGTTNRDVDRRNAQELKRVKAPLHTFVGEVSGDFQESDMNTPRELHLKVGAQVMFVKNDTGAESRRYFNGKIGKITKIKEDIITVDCSRPDGSHVEDPIQVERTEWQKIRYEWNSEKGEIEEIKTGSYIQFPIKLAWAITVHKSQGLTFEHVYANLNGAFAAGQTYVALSRCTSFDGLKLAIRLRYRDVKVDEEVRRFAYDFADEAAIEALLTETSFQASAEAVEAFISRGEYAEAMTGLWQLKAEFPEQKERLAALEERLHLHLKALQQKVRRLEGEEE